MKPAGVIAALLTGTLVASAALAQTPTPPVAPPPGRQIEANKLSKVPKQTKFVDADYPAEAREKGIEADVILLLDIDQQGKVTSVGVSEPTNPPGMGFDEAAMIAAQQFEFEPAEMDGKPIAVQLGYKYKFRLAPPPAAGETAAPPADPAAPPDATAPARPARAPVANFVGLLRERGTRNPLPGVLVTVFREEAAADGKTGGKPVGFEATSDPSGAFAFFDLPLGEWKVLIEAPGYYPFRTTEEIRAGEATNATYFVERGSYNPYDVMVTAPRPRKEVSRTTLTAQEIDKVPGTAGDPLAVVQNFAGVARAPLLSGFIIVRGSAPTDTKVFVDGAEIPLIYHFGGLRSVIPVGILQSLDFYPGNFGPMFGRAIGGVVDVQIKKLKPPRIGGYLDVSLLDTGVYVEAPLGSKGSLAFAARRSYIDVILNAVVPDDATVNLVTAPRYYDWQVVGNYRPTASHDLRLFILGSDDRLKILFDNPADLSIQLTGNAFQNTTTFYRSVLSDRWVPNEKFENHFQISQGRNKVKISFGELLFDLDVYTSQIRERARVNMTKWLSGSVGADVLFTNVSGHVRLPQPPKEGEPQGNFDLGDLRESIIKNDAIWSPAAFAELEIKPFDKLLILPGVRVDYFGQVHQTVAQPRVTTRWGVAERVTLKGGLGLFAQTPQPDETDPKFGNPNLKSEKAVHTSAGIEVKPVPHLTLDATGFYKDLYDLVRRSEARVMVGSDLIPLRYDNQGRGRAYGLELVARHELSNNFTGWLAYTLSRSERQAPGATDWRLFDYDQTHILTAVASYALPRNWTIGSRFRYVTASPYTPVVGGVFNASTDRYDAKYGLPNSSRLGAFHQLDLRVDKRWIYKGWILNAYLDIQNVYNRVNPEQQGYNFNYLKSRPQQGLPILPIIGLRADF